MLSGIVGNDDSRFHLLYLLIRERRWGNAIARKGERDGGGREGGRVHQGIEVERDGGELVMRLRRENSS